MPSQSLARTAATRLNPGEIAAPSLIPCERPPIAMNTFPRFIEKGSGPAIVFEHGTLMDATMFESQIAHLAAHGYRGIAHNSRTLVGPNVRHSLSDLVEDTRLLLDDLELERVVLAGMSVGAFMAIDFALKYPARLAGLVLIDGKASPYTDKQRADYIPEFSKCDIDGPVPRDFAAWDAHYCFGPTTFEQNRPLVDAWIDRWATLIPARAVWHQALSWLDKPDRTARLSEIETPTLVIHGEEDVPIPIAQAIDLLHYLPDATFVKVRNAGHSSNLENPAIVNHALASFMDRLHHAKS
jgi:3-oxoadipate enol-lactonase